MVLMSPLVSVTLFGQEWLKPRSSVDVRLKHILPMASPPNGCTHRSLEHIYIYIYLYYYYYYYYIIWLAPLGWLVFNHQTTCTALVKAVHATLSPSADDHRRHVARMLDQRDTPKIGDSAERSR